jgi:hypothetical protein
MPEQAGETPGWTAVIGPQFRRLIQVEALGLPEDTPVPVMRELVTLALVTLAHEFGLDQDVDLLSKVRDRQWKQLDEVIALPGVLDMVRSLLKDMA